MEGGSFQVLVNVNKCKPSNGTAKVRLITVWGFPLPVLCVYSLLTMIVKPVKSGLKGTSKRSLTGLPGKTSNTCAATRTFSISTDYLEPPANELRKEKKNVCSLS